MRWSQLKSRISELVDPSVRDRVALHQARYRYTREEVGRVWLTIDGREVASFDSSTYTRRRAELAHALEHDMTSPEADAVARRELREAGLSDDYEAIADLGRYLSLSIEDALASPSPLVRALAVIDRRVGKRRLRSLAANPIEHPLVRQLLRLRLDAGQTTANAHQPAS
jgi:hypothetical protein